MENNLHQAIVTLKNGIRKTGSLNLPNASTLAVDLYLETTNTKSAGEVQVLKILIDQIECIDPYLK